MIISLQNPSLRMLAGNHVFDKILKICYNMCHEMGDIMFGPKITYVGRTSFEPGTHYVLARYSLEKKGLMSKELNNQSQLSLPLGYTIVSADDESILYVNTQKVRAKRYRDEKTNQLFSPEFGTPSRTR